MVTLLVGYVLFYLYLAWRIKWWWWWWWWYVICSQICRMEGMNR